MTLVLREDTIPITTKVIRPILVLLALFPPTVTGYTIARGTSVNGAGTGFYMTTQKISDMSIRKDRLPDFRVVCAGELIVRAQAVSEYRHGEILIRPIPMIGMAFEWR